MTWHDDIEQMEADDRAALRFWDNPEDQHEIVLAFPTEKPPTTRAGGGLAPTEDVMPHSVLPGRLPEGAT